MSSHEQPWVLSYRGIVVGHVAGRGIELQREVGLLLAVEVCHSDLRLGLKVVKDVVGREPVARAPQEVVPALRVAVRAPAAAHQVEGLGQSTNVQGDPSGQRLNFVGFVVVVPMCALFCLGSSANLAELAWQVGNMVELPNQSQHNIVTDLMGHPVRCLDCLWLKYF